MDVLQVGLGNFGKRHLEAWHRLGFGERLWIAEPDEARWAETARYNFPKARLLRSAEPVLDRVQIVDIVTPTDSHFALAELALRAGKDVFLEKPMTMTSAQARELSELAQRLERLVQVGFYYRFHPASQRLKAELAAGRFGALRYLTGDFCGFKRARNDVGVTHTDGIHFLDLFNWLMQGQPAEVYAVCRDHFGRGLEDFSLVLLTYPDGTVAKLESGYIQPGRWKDKVVPGAMTTKQLTVVGERAAAELDFETETLTLHDAHHELCSGVWTAVVNGSVQVPLEPCDPVQMVCRELEAFLEAVRTRRSVGPGPVESGVQLAVLMEAIYESAKQGTPVRLEHNALAKTR
jgi:predicted dehydrogenase